MNMELAIIAYQDHCTEQKRDAHQNTVIYTVYFSRLTKMTVISEITRTENARLYWRTKKKQCKIKAQLS